MTSADIPPNVIDRYHLLFQQESDDDYVWLERSLNEHPALAQVITHEGKLPLRALLESRRPSGAVFSLLQGAGAEHDLFTASAARDVEAILRLIQGADESFAKNDAFGNTPLHWACTGGYGSGDDHAPEQAAELLLRAGANPNAANKFDEIPLDCAILHGGAYAVGTLLEHGASLSIQFAVADEDFEALDEFLLLDPHSITWRNKRDHLTLLHVAVLCESGISMIRKLLKAGASAFINEVDRFGWTPMYRALGEEAYDEAEALLAGGADPNRLPDSAQRRSLLETAILKDRFRLVELLLERGAEPLRSPDSELLCFVRSGEMVKVLVQREWDVNHSEENELPLAHATEEGRRSVVEALMNAGAAPTIESYIVLGDIDRVRMTIEAEPHLVIANCDPSTIEPVPHGYVELCCGSHKGSLLHYAVKSGSPPMVRLLLELGAPVQAIDREAGGPHSTTRCTTLSRMTSSVA